ncbi:MAG: hypothetical protein LBU86_07525, partial [Oscillospiraceae bacterium]|nr:hypothetical protein [Oscillospiraceae bacterium]
MGNCEYCGAAVEEGALCPCASARETATPPAKPEIPPEGAQGPAGGYPSYPYRVEEAPPEALRQPQAEYPPYFVPAQPPGGYVWPGYAPP